MTWSCPHVWYNLRKDWTTQLSSWSKYDMTFDRLGVIPPTDSICGWIWMKLLRNIFGTRILSFRFLNSSWRAFSHPKVPKNRDQKQPPLNCTEIYYAPALLQKAGREESHRVQFFWFFGTSSIVMWTIWWRSIMDIEFHQYQDPLGAMMILAEIFRQARSLWPLSSWLILVCGNCGKRNI